MTKETKSQFEPGKEYLTRSGLRARIYADDGVQETELHGAYCVAGKWLIGTWDKLGRYNGFGSSSFDLMPEKKTEWLNIYRSGMTCVHPSKDRADCEAGYNRLACIKIEYAIGEGLDE